MSRSEPFDNSNGTYVYNSSKTQIKIKPLKSSGHRMIMGGVDFPKGIYKEVKVIRGAFRASNFFVM